MYIYMHVHFSSYLSVYLSNYLSIYMFVKYRCIYKYIHNRKEAYCNLQVLGPEAEEPPHPTKRRAWAPEVRHLAGAQGDNATTRLQKQARVGRTDSE